MAVVTAVELDDIITFRETAGEADGGHGRLGARAADADFFHRWHPSADGAGHFDLEQVGDAEGDAALGDFVDRVGDDDGRVAENVRPP